MKARHLTPKDFGLRVRANPDSVAIVAANKARNAQHVEIGPVLWENRLAESDKLPKDSEQQELNRRAVIALHEKLSLLRLEQVSGLQVWREVPIDVVLDFFRSFRGAASDPYWGKGSASVVPIAESFPDVRGSDRWDVVFQRGSGAAISLAPGVDIGGSVRNTMGLDKRIDAIQVGNRRVATPADLLASISDEDRRAVSERDDFGTLSDQKKALAQIDHPVLMIYALVTTDPNPAPGLMQLPSDVTEPLIAVAVAFPRLDPEEALEIARRAKRYLVNAVWLRNSMGLVDDGDDVEDDEDF